MEGREKIKMVMKEKEVIDLPAVSDDTLTTTICRSPALGEDSKVLTAAVGTPLVIFSLKQEVPQKNPQKTATTTMK